VKTFLPGGHFSGGIMSNLRSSFGIAVVTLAGFLTVGVRPAMAQVPYTVAFNDGNELSWNNIYAQGFNTTLGANPVPPANTGDTVDLSQFQFFQNGAPNGATNVQLAIINNIFGNITSLTTSSSLVVGLSSNTIANTGSLTQGQAETFTFNNLPLVYGSDYAAVLVNNDGLGDLTPVLVSALTVDYSGGAPVTNYGTQSQFQYGVSNFITTNSFGSFFNIFSDAGDAAFSASLSTVPEPTTLGICGLAVLGLLRRRSR
jgi:hypothetical protein